ncbi:MAG: 30S ribosomal protein S9, partial [Candidatus Heimdallarchaeaceae archaeon]
PLEILSNELSRVKINEIFILAGADRREALDIKVKVKGGGFMGQAEAIRTAIARGLIEYFEDTSLKEKFVLYDKTIVSGDPRRTEPKHFGGRSSRSRFQKSYR